MDAEQLAIRLNAKRSGRQWVCRCVAHEDRDPSMLIFSGREEGAVQVRCLAGCTPGEIIDVLRDRGLWGGDEVPKAAPRKSTAALSTNQHRELARLIFSQAVPIASTMAAVYLGGRDILDVALDCPDIRFHPSCPRGEERRPAIVVAMRDMRTYSVCAIQRIYLASPGFGTVVKDGTPMMLGPAGGCAMMLHLVRGRSLNVAEGLESALAVIAMDHWPVWAMGSAGAIATLPVIDGVDELVIWADHDRLNPKTGRRPGQDAANECASRWSQARRSVVIQTPRIEGWDAADVWSDRLARQ